MDVVTFLWNQLVKAFDIMFNDFQLPIGISLGSFLVAILTLHFVISKLLPFLKSDKADKSE